ncbi:MAG TPA: hypothetical protein VFX45_05305 [Solirubrobacterales bacterium]|nr:hypothetical protein [Solirubrobacterales bacterium]
MTDRKTQEKKRDPWTDPDPQPGDFDEFLAKVRPEDIQRIEPGTVEVVLIGDMDPNEWVRRKWAREGRGNPARSHS